MKITPGKIWVPRSAVNVALIGYGVVAALLFSIGWSEGARGGKA